MSKHDIIEETKIFESLVIDQGCKKRGAGWVIF